MMHSVLDSVDYQSQMAAKMWHAICNPPPTPKEPTKREISAARPTPGTQGFPDWLKT